MYGEITTDWNMNHFDYRVVGVECNQKGMPEVTPIANDVEHHAGYDRMWVVSRGGWRRTSHRIAGDTLESVVHATMFSVRFNVGTPVTVIAYSEDEFVANIAKAFGRRAQLLAYGLYQACEREPRPRIKSWTNPHVENVG